MSMEITNNYSNYGTNSTSNSVSNGKLSETAQNYLNDLKQKYPTVNITVADFANERQKLSYMMGSSGLQNVAISGNIVEKMANDPSMAAKYEKLIADMPNDEKETQKYADEHNINIYGSGMVVDNNGKVTYWAVGGDKEARENPGTAYKEKVQKQLEEKRAEKKEKEILEKKKREEKNQMEALEEKRVEMAETKENLLEKLSANVGNSDNQMNLRKSMEEGKGTQVDLSI